MKPFVVDVFKTDSKNNVTKRCLESETLENAKHLMEVHSQTSDVTRIVVSQRAGTRFTRLDKKYVWKGYGILRTPLLRMVRPKGGMQTVHLTSQPIPGW